MKSTIIEQPKEVKPEYPCLKQSAGKVVLFTGPNTGIVVNENKSIGGIQHGLGHFSTNWAETIFDPFPGKIELSN